MQTTLGTKVYALNSIKAALLESQLKGQRIDREKVSLLVLWIVLCWKTS